jgi:hypothetical protein
LVNLVEDWKVLENYAGFKRGFYQLIDDEQVIEIRLKVGELGFKKEFTNKEDTSLINILDFCKSKKYIEVSNNIMDEFFFKHIPEKEEEK